MASDTEVALQEMLLAREKRAERQKRLLKQYALPLVSFTMNIAGPVKNGKLIRRGFIMGREALLAQLAGVGCPVLEQEEIFDKTGCEGLYVVDALPEALKKITCEIEERSEIGRLLDLDVLDQNGKKLERESPRRCLICGKPVFECSRIRAHGVDELQEKTKEILIRAVNGEDAKTAAGFAIRALLYEVATTPKPGLVDRWNNGSHKDMDFYTFLNSVSVLWPYFENCVMIGRETASQLPADTGRALCWEGKMAERTMFLATEGVNTHKGAVFSLGLICGALGRLDRKNWGDTDLLLSLVADMVRDRVESDFSCLDGASARTAGERSYLAYGVKGVRGEAENGYPTVRENGLPVLEKGIARGLGWDRAGAAALLTLAAHTVDTNMISRGGLERQQRAVEKLHDLLAQSPYPDPETIIMLDREYMEENLSPGGSADLLTICYLLHFLKGAANEPIY